MSEERITSADPQYAGAIVCRTGGDWIDTGHLFSNILINLREKTDLSTNG